jgi:hypothetical protein
MAKVTFNVCSGAVCVHLLFDLAGSKCSETQFVEYDNSWSTKGMDLLIKCHFNYLIQ